MFGESYFSRVERNFTIVQTPNFNFLAGNIFLIMGKIMK